MSKKTKRVESQEIKLDLGCGKSKKPGFIGVDCKKFDGVDVILDVGKDKWPWKNESVDEATCSHLIEHLEPEERVHFVNELWRVLKFGAKCLLVTPHWASVRAYGDLTHKWPPVSEFWFYYLSEDWRKIEAPHNDEYKCHFEATWGYSLHPTLVARNTEYQQYAITNFKEAVQDLICTLTKAEPKQ